MARKYSSEDFSRTLPKPLLTRVVKRFGLVAYTWKCSDPSGSTGYGTCAAHAFSRWRASWLRRKRHYCTEGARQRLSLVS